MQILDCGERMDRWTDGLTYQPTWQVVESLLTNLFLSHLRSTDAYADINACADEEDDKMEEDGGDKRDKAYKEEEEEGGVQAHRSFPVQAAYPSAGTSISCQLTSIGKFLSLRGHFFRTIDQLFCLAVACL